MLILIPGPRPAEVIHNRGDRSIINSSAFYEEGGGRRGAEGRKNQASSTTKPMVMHFSMLVIEQMWSELSRMEGGKKGDSSQDCNASESCPRIQTIQDGILAVKSQVAFWCEK